MLEGARLTEAEPQSLDCERAQERGGASPRFLTDNSLIVNRMACADPLLRFTKNSPALLQFQSIGATISPVGGTSCHCLHWYSSQVFTHLASKLHPAFRFGSLEMIFSENMRLRKGDVMH